MNEKLKVLKERRSVRKYKAEQIRDEELNAILEAGTWAPSAKGKSTWERAEGLIAIAHPQFREELIAEAEKMHIWRRSNKR